MAAAAIAAGAIAGGQDLSGGMASIGAYQAQKHETRRAFKRALLWELLAPSHRMEGLRRAGINPILAGGVPVGGAGSAVQVARAQAPRFGGQDIAGQARGFARLGPEAETAKALSEITKAEARAKTKDYGEPDKTQSDFLVRTEIDAKANQSEMYKAQERAADAAADQSAASAQQILQNTKLLKFSEAGAEAESELYRAFGPFLKGMEKLGVTLPKAVVKGRRKP